VKDAMQDGHVFVWWDHVDAIRFNPGRILDLKDLHFGNTLQKLGHDVLMRGVKMLNQDKGHAAVGWHVAQELLECLKPPCGGPNSDDGEDLVPGFFSRGFIRPLLVLRLRGTSVLPADCQN